MLRGFPKQLGSVEVRQPAPCLRLLLFDQVLALKSVFWLFSYSAPCQALEPLRVTICTSPPAERAKVLELLVTTRISWRLSTGVGMAARGVAAKPLPACWA